MDLKILTTPTILKPGTDLFCSSLTTDVLNVATVNASVSVNTVTVNATDVETKTINMEPVFTPGAFSATFSGYSTPTAPASAFNGATVSTIKINTPSSYWTIGDTQVTYDGPSGLGFYYSSNAVFVTDISTIYQIYPIISGVPKLEDRSIFNDTIASLPFQGTTFGARIFTNGDILQIGIDALYTSGMIITPDTITLDIFRIA